jgi:hypothetical protein
VYYVTVRILSNKNDWLLLNDMRLCAQRAINLAVKIQYFKFLAHFPDVGPCKLPFCVRVSLLIAARQRSLLSDERMARFQVQALWLSRAAAILLLSLTRKENIVKDWVMLRPMVSRPVSLGVKLLLGPKNTFMWLPHSCSFVEMGRPLWREDGFVIYRCQLLFWTYTQYTGVDRRGKNCVTSKGQRRLPMVGNSGNHFTAIGRKRSSYYCVCLGKPIWGFWSTCPIKTLRLLALTLGWITLFMGDMGEGALHREDEVTVKQRN